MLGMLLLQAAAQAVPPVTVPTDWSLLAPMPYVTAPQVVPTLSGFVAAEIAAGRCAVPRPADGRYLVKVDVAALVAPNGMVRRAVPRAIRCPTVEQYTAGLVTSFARANLRPAAGERWYLATIVYDWRG